MGTEIKAALRDNSGDNSRDNSQGKQRWLMKPQRDGVTAECRPPEHIRIDEGDRPPRGTRTSRRESWSSGENEAPLSAPES